MQVICYCNFYGHTFVEYNCYWNLVYTLLNCTLPRLQFFVEVGDGLILTRLFHVGKMGIHSNIKSLQFTVLMGLFLE